MLSAGFCGGVQLGSRVSALVLSAGFCGGFQLGSSISALVLNTSNLAFFLLLCLSLSPLFFKTTSSKSALRFRAMMMMLVVDD